MSLGFQDLQRLTNLAPKISAKCVQARIPKSGVDVWVFVLDRARRKPINSNILGGTVSGTYRNPPWDKRGPVLGQTGTCPWDKPAVFCLIPQKVAILSRLSLGRLLVFPWDDRPARPLKGRQNYSEKCLCVLWLLFFRQHLSLFLNSFGMLSNWFCSSCSQQPWLLMNQLSAVGSIISFSQLESLDSPCVIAPPCASQGDVGQSQL